MKKMRKTVSIVLALLLALSAFAIVPISAGAAETSKQSSGGGIWEGVTGNISFSLNYFDATLTLSGNGDMPDYTDDNKAPWAGDSDFIETVTIGDGVTSVGNLSFCGFTALEGVTLGSKVESIGEYAFEGATKLKSVEVPSDVLMIKAGAFKGCSSLENVKFEEGLVKIAEGAFYDCPKLTSVFIPKSVKKFGATSLGYNEGEAVDGFTIEGYEGSAAQTYAETEGFTFIPIKEGTEPATTAPETAPLTEVPGTEAPGTDPETEATEATEPEPEPEPEPETEEPGDDEEEAPQQGKIGDITWELDSSELYIRGQGAMPDFTDEAPAPWSVHKKFVSAIIIDGGVTTVGDLAFLGFDEADTISIGSSVKSIGEYAFAGCGSLEEISVPNSVKILKEGAFKACGNLKKVNLGSGVTTIGDHAIFYCDSLKEITVPASVNTIGDEALGYSWMGDNRAVISGFTISGYDGSEAYKYALKNDIKFDSLGAKPSTPEGETNPPETPEQRGTFPGIYLDSAADSIIVYNIDGNNSANIEGVNYDAATNTLTFNNTDLFANYKLTTYLMGGDFRLEVIGECTLAHIDFNDCGVTITGTGTLKVNSTDDHGICLEQSREKYKNSGISIDDTVAVEVKAKSAAFCVKGTSLGVDDVITTGGKSIGNIKIADSKSEQVKVAVEGATLSQWTDGIGYRFRVERDDEPGAVYVARGYSETKYSGGKPSSTVYYYEVKKCYYDRASGLNIITDSIGLLTSDEFHDGGYKLIDASGASVVPYVLASGYYMNSVSAELYKDAGGNAYAVSGNDVYTYSEESKVGKSDGKEVYRFTSSDADKATLVPDYKEVFSYNYEYNGTEYVKEKAAAGPEGTTSPDTASGTETQPGGDTTQPATEASQPGGETTPTQEGGNQPGTEATTAPVITGSNIWVGGVKVTEENAANITGKGIEGRVYYDAATNTLILDGATITSSYNYINNYYAGIYTDKGVNIEIVGRCIIKPEDVKSGAFGLACLGGEIKLTGSGSLDTIGVQAQTFTISKGVTVTSSVSSTQDAYYVGVMAITLNVNGILNAESTSIYEDSPAVIGKYITVGEGALLKAVAKNTITVSNGTPAQTKAIYINDDGTMTVNGTVKAEAAGTYSGDQMNRGYALYGSNNSKVVLGAKAKLTLTGKRQAVVNIKFSDASKFTVKAGDSASNAKVVSVKNIGSAKYVSVTPGATKVKKTNTLKVSSKNKTFKASALASKKGSYKALSISKAKGSVKVTKKKVKINKKLFSKITVTKKGKLTIKKGDYKKGTYKLELKVTAAGNSDYTAKTITKTVTITIK